MCTGWMYYRRAVPGREASESAAAQKKECAMKDRIGHLSRRSGGLIRLPGAHRRLVTAAVAAVTLVIATVASVSATTTTAASASGRAAHLDSAPPVQARVAKLLG
jgi:hypothetical protein